MKSNLGSDEQTSGADVKNSCRRTMTDKVAKGQRRQPVGMGYRNQEVRILFIEIQGNLFEQVGVGLGALMT